MSENLTSKDIWCCTKRNIKFFTRINSVVEKAHQLGYEIEKMQAKQIVYRH